MTHRITFLLLFLVGISNLGFAQTAKPSAAKAAAQPQRERDVVVILDWQFMIVSDEAIKSLQEHSKLTLPERLNLPDINPSSILDQQQFGKLLDAASCDHGGNVLPATTIRLVNGKKGEATTIRRDFVETVQATVSDDRKTIDLRLEFQKPDGLEALLTVTKSVPLGSHLVVHPVRYSECGGSDSWEGWLLDKLFPNRKHKVWFTEGFLVITPRIAAGKPAG
jgi:hypothetical protein